MALSKLGRGRMTAKINKLYLRWVAYGLVLLAVSLLQSAPAVFPAIGGAHPVPLISAVVCIAMFEGPVAGAVIGAASGLLWALYTHRLFGFDALLLLAIGCACGLLVRVFLRNNYLSALLLNGAVLLLYLLTDWLVRFVLFLNPDALYALTHILLPNALYTFILSPIMYAIIYRIARGLRETV